MKKIETDIKDVYIIEPEIFQDERGWFFETWSKKKLENIGLFYNFVQENHSFSKNKSTLRGLHFQLGQYSQAKLVRCTRGSVLDIAVDLRKNSPTYKKYVACILSEENKKELFIPRGFAHGFLTLTNNVEFVYKADSYYNPQADRTIAWNDSELNIDWGIISPILSEKDKTAPYLKDIEFDF